MHMTQDPTHILIELDVTAFQEHAEDNVVQVWGYVGDYEVSVWLPRDDERVQKLKRQMNRTCDRAE